MSARRASYLNDFMLTNESSGYFHESARERVTQAKAEREEEKKVRRRCKKMFQIFVSSLEVIWRIEILHNHDASECVVCNFYIFIRKLSHHMI